MFLACLVQYCFSMEVKQILFPLSLLCNFEVIKFKDMTLFNSFHPCIYAL